ncbi:hypothetical protein GW17_00042736 [Ensete ventricosum]|nr:hypothetical protein GW17_00042736 [Ensete ventricosum]
MTLKTSTRESPFNLAFGVEEVLPSEVVHPTYPVKFYEEQASDKQLWENLDLLEERRAKVHLRALAYKKVVAKLYNHRVCPWKIMTGHLVLSRAEASDPTHTWVKLALKWEGQYCIISTIQDGTYTLAMMEGKPLPRILHISNLKKLYM